MATDPSLQCFGLTLSELIAIVEEAIASQIKPVTAHVRDDLRMELHSFFGLEGCNLVNAKMAYLPADKQSQGDDQWLRRHLKIELPKDNYESALLDDNASEVCSDVVPLPRCKNLQVPKQDVARDGALQTSCHEAQSDFKSDANLSEITELPCVPADEGVSEVGSGREESKTCWTNSNDTARDEFGNPSLFRRVDQRISQRPKYKQAFSRVESTKWTTRVKHWARKIVSHAWFDRIVGAVIVLNATCVGLQIDYHARYLDFRPTAYSIFLSVTEVVFVMLFMTELALRLIAYGSRFFAPGVWHWHLFDVSVIFISAVELIMNHALQNVKHGLPTTNFSALRVVRLVRLVRVVRLARVLHLIKELRTLVRSIVNSLRSLFWTCVLLFILIFTIALYFTQVVTEARVNGASHVGLKQFFGTLPVAVRSFYQAITGGIDWQDLVEPLEHDISDYISIVICLYIAFATLAMLNVVTGTFVENVLHSAKEDRDMFMIDNARELFETLDGGLRGTLTWQTFAARLDSPPLQEFFKSIGVDRSEAQSVFKLLDLDDSGEISSDEFLSGCLRVNGPARALDMYMLMREVKNFESRIVSQMRAA
eukprot:TRINITY_DN17172_c0_g2_i1.p1 TRINITY_DN17172_c0_g2~~TRINITY_DN17172_c0_g2_i1.p1  ORF type:complete len:657 (-),score=71.72 TRINITY_DN17172_c0_g2_i1:75-1859(-)